MPSRDNRLEIDQRAERIQAAIAELSSLRADIEAQGELAPNGCYIARYSALRSNKVQ